MSSYAPARSDDSGSPSIECAPVVSHPQVDRNVYTAISVSDEGPCDKAKRAEKPPSSHSSTTATYSISRRLHSRWIDGWAAELMSCALSILAMSCLVATLHYCDGRVITTMPLKISINTLVAILAGITKSSLLLPVAECISQSKWLWYSKARRLMDFEDFDLASRGPWGSLLLIFRLKHRHVAVLGAWITLLALAIDPFTQQIIHPVVCDRAVLGILGKVPRAGNLTIYDAPNHGVQGLEMSMLASIYIDLIEGDRPIDVQCLTGNCTFTQKSNADVSYQTLGFESACVDVSEEVRMETTAADQTWSIPRLATNETIKPVNANDAVWGHSADTVWRFGEVTRLVATMNDRGRINFPEYWTAKQNEAPIVSFTTLMLNVDRSNCEGTFCQTSTDDSPDHDSPDHDSPDHDSLDHDLLDLDKINYVPLAVECKIWPAILTLKSRIDSARLYETTVDSEPLKYHADPEHRYLFDRWDAMPAQVLRDGIWEPCSGSIVETPVSSINDIPEFSSMTTGYAPDCVWNIDYLAVIGIRKTFKRMYQNQTLKKEGSKISGITGEAWLKSLWHNGQSNLSTVEEYASKVARAMTKQIRRIAASIDPEYGFAKGTVMETDTCIQVRWAWIIFPASLIAFTMILLVTTICKTWRSGEHGRRYGVWKSSSLAVLFSSLQEEARGSEALEKNSDMELHAKELKVSLRPVDGGWRLG